MIIICESIISISEMSPEIADLSGLIADKISLIFRTFVCRLSTRLRILGLVFASIGYLSVGFAVQRFQTPMLL